MEVDATPGESGRTPVVKVELVARRSSRGIWSAVHGLRDALVAAGVDATIVETISRRAPAAHFQLGNSTRPLLLDLARRRGDVVSLHDVVPRNPVVRAALVAGQRRVLDRHHVVVHTGFAADLLRGAGFDRPIRVIPHLQPVAPADPERVAALRTAWRADDFDAVLVAAGQLRRHKGLDELLAAARQHPEVRLVLVGSVSERESAAAVATASANVVHVASPDDDEFCQLISAADALISLRRTSVGESSGPVVQAHRLHKPVVGLRVGSLPELCGPGDVLLDATADASDLFAAAIAAGLADLASGAPQIPDPAAVATAMLALYDEVGLGR